MSQTNDGTDEVEVTGLDCTARRSTVFSKPALPQRKSSIAGMPTLLPRKSSIHPPRRVDRSAKTVLTPIQDQSQCRTLSRGTQDDESEEDIDGEDEGSTDSEQNCKERICRAVASDNDLIMNIIVLINWIILVLETSLPHMDLWNSIEYAMSVVYAAGFCLKRIIIFCRNRRQENLTSEDSAASESLLDRRPSRPHVMEINRPVGTNQPLVTAISAPTANGQAGQDEFWTFWDTFDTVISIFGMLEVSVFFYHFEHHFQTKWHERLIADITQFMRVLQVIRLFRLHELFKESALGGKLPCLTWVRVHWKGFVIGTYALGSAGLLLIMFVIICAMFLVLTVGQVPEDDPDYEIFHNRMGNLWSASITLFQLMVEPNFVEFINLIEYWPPRPIFTIFLILFIVLGNFGFLVMLNGVVSQEITEHNEEYKEKTEKLKKYEWEYKLKNIQNDTEKLIFNTHPDSAPLDEFINNKEGLIDIFEKAGLHYADRDLETMMGMLNVKSVDEKSEERIEKADFRYFVEQLVLGMRPMLAMEQFYGIVTTKKKVERLERHVRKLTEQLDLLLLKPQMDTVHGRQEEQKIAQ